MTFDYTKPLETDPLVALESGYAWLPSKQPSAYYSWLQVVTNDVDLHKDSLTIPLGAATLSIYYGRMKQELLYRIVFSTPPVRFILKPAPYCMFWSFGDNGDASKSIKYHYRDKYLSLHEWTDKKSFLAVLRQNNYINDTPTIWTR